MMDFTSIETPELTRVLGILMCERMIYSRPPKVEAEINARIDALEAEIKRRAVTSTLGTKS